MSNFNKSRANTIECPYCKNTHSQTVAAWGKGNSLRRQRKCLSCGEKYSTIEISSGDYNDMIRAINALDTIIKRGNSDGNK